MRAIWDDEHAKWWFSVLDIVGVLNQQKIAIIFSHQHLCISIQSSTFVKIIRFINSILQQYYGKEKGIYRGADCNVD